jgi:spermidine synthase
MNVQNADEKLGWTSFRDHVRANNDLLYARDGLTASVLVAVQPDSGNTYLAVNGKTDASSHEDLETQIAVGHLPLLFHDAPRDALVIGLASGITVGSVATHDLEHIRVVEVEGAMVGAARCFAPFNHRVLDDPRVELSINDARNELQFNPATYDVIIAEPSNPWMTVAANLFTEDFFRIGRSRLRPGGIFGQWIQTYCLTPRSLGGILAAFHRAFPHVLVFEATNGIDLIMLGSAEPLTVDIDKLEQRSSDLWIRADLARVNLRSGTDLAAMLQTGGPAIDQVVRGKTVNTDDNGLVEFGAPKALYLDTQDTNMAMLQGSSADPLSPLLNVVRTRSGPDEVRLELIERWLRRDERDRAKKALEYFTDTEMKSRAADLVAKAR